MLKQTQEVPSSSADAVLPTEMLEDHPKEDNGSRLAVINHSPQFLGNRLQSLQVFKFQLRDPIVTLSSGIGLRSFRRVTVTVWFLLKRQGRADLGGSSRRFSFMCVSGSAEMESM